MIKMSVNSLGPFQDFDIYGPAVSDLDPKDISSVAQVNQEWNTWSRADYIWGKVSEREGIPLVANVFGGPRTNLKEDCRILAPRTISSRIIGEFLGKVVGQVPRISEYWFNKFAAALPNPYQQGKLFRDSFVVLVDPSFIERTVNRKTPLAVDEVGNLVEVSPDSIVEQTITFPLSLRNLEVISRYPLKGKENLPVFNKIDSWTEAFEHSTSFPAQVGLRIMSRSILEESRGLGFGGQQALVEKKAPNQGFELESVRRRALFDAVSILTTGECPDRCGEHLWTYVRGPDTVTINGRAYRLAVGGFAPGAGVSVRDYDFVNGSFGVVPGGSAEVPGPLELGHLAIGEGH
jgi:hypothetical protein